MRIRTLVLIAGLLAVSRLPAPPVPKSQVLTPDLIHQYRAAGGVYGGIVPDDRGEPKFEGGEPAAARGMPAFQFKGNSTEAVGSLPALTVRHALLFEAAPLRDADMDRLAKSPGVVHLKIARSRLTDEGVKRIGQFPDLHTLVL